MKIFDLALITGASSGIGEALCYLLARNKINLIITGRDEHKLNLIANELKKLIIVDVIALDLSEKTQKQLLIQTIRDRCPDLLINNAGYGLYGDILTHKTEEQLDLLKVNSEVVMELSIEAARSLYRLNKKGVILNVSSVVAFMDFPGFAVYAASKAFINHFSRAFDVEMQVHGIRILTSCPGRVATHFGSRASGQEISSSKGTMTPEYAAQQIWWQIQTRKPVHIFNWSYRLSVIMYQISPKNWILKKLQKNIHQLSSKKDYLKD